MPNQSISVAIPEKNVFLPVLLFLVLGVALAYLDKELGLNTFLLESVHALVVTGALIACLIYGRRYPHIRQFGWTSIILGMAFLTIGTGMDLLDDPPMFGFDGEAPFFPFGPSWERAFIKKTLGYTIGIGMFTYGFFRWIPWMINTRLDIHRLNLRLSNTNRNLNRALMSLDDHVESARIGISRELHDDVAQQLTFVNIQHQLCRKDLESGDPARINSAKETLHQISVNVSEALRSVRQISGDLRPASLFSLGLIPGLEHFVEKMQHQYPHTQIVVEFLPIDPWDTHTRIEKTANDQQLLHLFRIVQEGVRNAIKHAGATDIHVLLQESKEEGNSPEEQLTCLLIRVKDNGKGLPWPQIPSDEALIAQGHLGIVGLKERVKALSGTFLLNNCKDEPGACLEIRITS